MSLLVARRGSIAIRRGASVVVPDVTTATVDGSFDVGGQESGPRAVAFSADGTVMYITGTGSVSVWQYDLSTAWDVTTASVDGSFDVSDEEGEPLAVSFSSDGTRMYVTGSGSDAVWQYDLSTAWDVTTATVNGSHDVSSEDASPQGVAFSADGTRMFVTGTRQDAVWQYDLSTAWDVTSAGTQQGSHDVSGEDTIPTGVTFSADGTRVYISGSSSDSVWQYDLSTAWDVTSAGTQQGSHDVSGEDTAPQGVSFSADGTVMYVIGFSTTSVYQYS